jgi:phosphatidate cytidylyltransferase
MKFNNLSVRIAVALIGIPALIALSITGRLAFLAFILGIGIVALYEFHVMVKSKGHSANLLLSGLALILLIINAYSEFIGFETLITIFIPLILFYELFRNKNSAIQNIGSTLIGIFYIGLFSASLIKIREFYSYSGALYEQGGFLIISILVTIWVCDSAAYFFGIAFGKNKLFPRVSPNKSWEGAFAGFAFSILSMIVLRSFLIDFLQWIDVLSLGIIIGSIGQAGDLIESLFKRDAGVKDSSSILPGHGGVFDRFDSLLYSAPVIYLYLHFFVK